MAKPKKPPVYVSKILKDAVLARLDDPASAMKYPALMECMMPVFEDKKLIRQAGKLTISPEGAHWKVKLDCPTEVLTTSFACPSLVECFERINELLAVGHAVWSPGWKKSKQHLPTIDDVIQ